MATRHISLRVEEQTLRQLESRSRRAHQSLSHVVKTLIDDGLRMEAHPGVIFRPSPTGPTPALVDGPAIWVVARIFQGLGLETEGLIEKTAELTALRNDQVRVALGYYLEFRDEIDDWIRNLDEYSAEAEAAWRRQQHALHG